MMKNIFYLFFVFVVFSGIVATTTISYYKQKKTDRLYNYKLKETCPIHVSIQSNNIILYGDSRIFEWGEPDFGEGFVAINYGVTGATTEETLHLIENTIFDVSPKWYIVQVGINDLVAASMLDTNNQQRVQTKALLNIKKIIKKLSSSGSHVIVLTVVPPISPSFFKRLIWGKGIENASHQLSLSLLSESSKNITVIDMRRIFLQPGTRSWNTAYSKDALHWNNKAYEALTFEVNKLISKTTQP
ncbi:lysophospholipase L1-like esterase [Desulfocapsa sulfexigens DSM 10523]|uniref:Lysophospholipase L1-like esterase n=1 Tax=Desulfocapsa sulfexigens (strain DSM 10523 / SB164P1) TaxID=1167006 RepID=M1PE96_DESSD|nr:GDSL-type esterase/lipase family protein [Desulfocapsa sulfexigens]AGF79902.1 lysophospholipase L1-like esterase [Desulfocapsa sulfexigens DSM 10523]